MVATFGCLFHGIQGICVKYQSTFTAFSRVVFGLAPVDCHRWACFFWPVAGTDAHKGSLCLVSGSRLGLLDGVALCQFVTLCVCGTRCMRRIGVIFSVFSFFVMWWWEESCHSYFITTHSAYTSQGPQGSINVCIALVCLNMAPNHKHFMCMWVYAFVRHAKGVCWWHWV